ncbi:RNA polymerase-binding protein DksA [Arcobacter roscoffensis]|uniref:RNA polymerase-binding protein DksA n=1 Tax=Arcobacter roscoffensis TaxID=2961520 RepID=A0ABY5E8P5_9BACT|nr:RNA polymerase-binding protein DksA [Arcobacter roscoffensis]UTJ07088.1 RNA polymerase-binding protein DksA [Arcobacter roscoffensis]
MANAKQIEELKQTLLERKELIINNINESRESINSLKNSECNDEFDYAEVSSDSFKEGIIANQQVKELEEIEDAIKRIQKGTYGVCEMCDESIAIGRLRAKPFAKFCTPCREIYEVEK